LVETKSLRSRNGSANNGGNGSTNLFEGGRWRGGNTMWEIREGPRIRKNERKGPLGGGTRRWKKSHPVACANSWGKGLAGQPEQKGI